MYELGEDGRPVFRLPGFPRDGLILPGGSVRLSDSQVELANRIALHRKRNPAGRDYKVGARWSHDDVQAIGARAEVAFRQLSGLEWRDNPLTRMGDDDGIDFVAPNGETIDARGRGGGGEDLFVKTETGLRANLAVNLGDEKARGGDFVMYPIGWITRDEWFEKKEPGPTRDLAKVVEIVRSKYLKELPQLFERVGLKWPAPVEKRKPAGLLPHQRPPQGRLFE